MGTKNRWYENAVFYAIDVEAFADADADGDGVGDFAGLTERLDYLAGLGIDCIWLLPFYPSPNRDNGYGVADYYGVDDRHGTLGDFVEFVREADQRGIRVIIDLRFAVGVPLRLPGHRAARAGRACRRGGLVRT